MTAGPPNDDATRLAALLAAAGFVAADDEADELLACADGDRSVLDALLARRLTGEPLAWLTGRATFCGHEILVFSGVYVPRWHSEELARRAVEALAPDGVAVDCCTGTGAIARVLKDAHPGARVVGCDVDEIAVACARANGVEAYRGDLLAPLPSELVGRVDVVVAVVPYVPTSGLVLLQRDTLVFESPLAYDGGPDGTALLRRVAAESAGVLKAGGVLLLELGGEQAQLISGELARLGYCNVDVLTDEEGDPRGVRAILCTPAGDARRGR